MSSICPVTHAICQEKCPHTMIRGFIGTCRIQARKNMDERRKSTPGPDLTDPKPEPLPASEYYANT